MCIFSQPVQHVSNTSIFARFLEDGHQALVYSMTYAADDALAMVLPLPIRSGASENAVRFINLERYPQFFRDLARGFPAEMVASGSALALQPQATRHTLKVHDVGDFEASFVPTQADFDRLDPRFRLPKLVWDQMPTWRNDGFAVFMLKQKPHPRPSWFARLLGRAPTPSAPRHVHPMALVFPSRTPESLFFPTVHVHDGIVHRESQFDHTLYCQTAGEPEGWDRSHEPAWTFMEAHLTEGLVEPGALCWRRTLHGTLPNQDTWLEPSAQR